MDNQLVILQSKIEELEHKNAILVQAIKSIETQNCCLKCYYAGKSCITRNLIKDALKVC